MIQLLIENESDLYNPYDPSRTRINEGVYHYLKSYCSPLEASKHVHDTLQIITDSPIDEERFQRVLQDAVKNSRRAVWEGVLGLLFCALGIMLSVYLDEVLLTVISLLGTMGIMDAITINTTVNHDLKNLKKLLEPISDIRLEVVQRSGVS